MANKDTSKQWFETGDYPTAPQFAQTFDFLRWNDEKILLDDLHEDVKGVIESAITINAVRCERMTIENDSTFLMLESLKLVAVAIKNNTGDSMVLKFGTTDGGEEIGSVELEPLAMIDVEFGRTFWNETTVYVTGVTAEIILLIDRK